MIRLQWSDERFLAEFNLRSTEDSTAETLAIDSSTIEDSALDDQTEVKKSEIEEVIVANETAFKILYTAQMVPTTEVADTKESINHIEDAAIQIASRKTTSSSASIYVTSKVASLLKNAGIAEQSQQSTTVAATKRKHPETKTVTNSPPKRPKEYCDLDMSNIALPQYVISSKTFVTRNEPIDGVDLVDDDTKDTTTAVRTLDVNMVRLSGSDAENLNFDSIQPVHKTEEDNGTTMYVCKYCPKAFSTSYHLILHSRKSHVCQFCLQGFPKVAELHRHVKEAHNEFDCPFCDRVFVCNSNLRAHIRRTHNVSLPANVSLMTLDKDSNH